ncbi:6-phosphogluconolactonase [Hydrococcus rivularis NIES-593]|uniref:6-phosphogluconolactonase n=1 Tax=Hydrococcus rivularis NIES-593 TaxID=1921803 RepID=A0A1U7HHE8_9CYAN|nr:6-phosphogluconolactonase [Hydrococcus rivularis]OKH22958.1 6-phosphogluconolactonase [Hydrococcus rivularis NIES-593]
MKKLVEILPDKQALIERSLTLVLEKMQSAIQERGQCTLALSGGSTPKPLYEALAEQPLPWEKIQVFWGDERYVPSDHPESNQRMARQAWLDRVSIPAANIHPMPTSAGDPARDAQNYETELQQWFKLHSGEVPVFDIVLLGIGDDGHTASLFPRTEALKVSDRLVTVGNKDGQPRLTFTARLINQARCVIFLVAGESKRPALKQIFAPSGDEMTYPARLVQPKGELWWLLDKAAGAELNSTTSDQRAIGDQSLKANN